MLDDRRPRTWLAITAQGRAALAAELVALRELINLVERPTRAPAPSRRRPRTA